MIEPGPVIPAGNLAWGPPTRPPYEGLHDLEWLPGCSIRTLSPETVPKPPRVDKFGLHEGSECFHHVQLQAPRVV